LLAGLIKVFRFLEWPIGRIFSASDAKSLNNVPYRVPKTVSFFLFGAPRILKR